MQAIYIFCIFVYITAITIIFGENLNDIQVWGPGLRPHEIVMPARYFFVKLKNHEWNTSINEDLKIFIQGNNHNNYPCRIRTNLLDRSDGIYIFRYKLFESCNNLQISILYKNVHVLNSPYKFDQVLLDECNCPIKINSWLEKLECTLPVKVVKDLKEFEGVNWDMLRDQVISIFNVPGSISLCHYVIKDNLLYRKCYGKYTGFKMFMDNILLSLSRKLIFPDVEFFVNLGDWPLSSATAKYPIFSWCSSTDSFDIVMPTYDISESTLENLGRVTLDMLSVQGNANRPWKDRIPKGFWRGRDSNKERLKLIDIARENPDLYNVSLTNFFFFRDQEKEYGKSDHISFFNFFDYKYQINIDGTVAAYRTPYLFGGGSLIFKQDSKYYEHFYDDLLPNVHYIPIKKDLSDLTDKIKWARANDDLAYKIAIEGQKFAVDNLLPINIFCYYTHLINEFSKIISSPIKVLEGMELVQSSKSDSCKCNIIKDEL